MGMSTHVVGFQPPDEKWQRMKTIYDACEAEGVEVPTEVWEFFGWETPDEAGREVPLPEAVVPWRYDTREGFEVVVDKIPSNVSRIRFYNSW